MKKRFRYLPNLLRETASVAIAIACVYGGFLGFQYLGDNRDVVKTKPVERPIALVETMEVSRFDQPLPVRAEGFVRPYRQFGLSAQSGGRVSRLHPAILNLGTFSKGEVLVALDDSAERAMLNQSTADVEATRARLDLVVAQLERTEALRERGLASQQALDQLLSQQAELAANLGSLRAARESAEIGVENKRIVAPFDGAVLEKLEEVGSVVGAGQYVAEIYTHDLMEVVIPVREAEATLIPGLFQQGTAKANVTVDFAGQSYQWDARITRVNPALDPRTRTLSVTVGLDDIANPRLSNPESLSSGAIPALINAFARVEIDGIQLPNTYAIPSTSIRSGNQIWLFEQSDGDHGSLVKVDVKPTHKDGEITFVRVDDWPDDTRLIRTTLAAPESDMPLRDITPATMSLAARPETE